MLTECPIAVSQHRERFRRLVEFLRSFERSCGFGPTSETVLGEADHLMGRSDIGMLTQHRRKDSTDIAESFAFERIGSCGETLDDVVGLLRADTVGNFVGEFGVETRCSSRSRGSCDRVTGEISPLLGIDRAFVDPDLRRPGIGRGFLGHFVLGCQRTLTGLATLDRRGATLCLGEGCCRVGRRDRGAATVIIASSTRSGL